MKQVLFDRLKTNIAQCISDGTIYFVKDSNGNFTQLALGDGSKSHVVGIGPKMDDTTKQELMSKLGLTISSDMGTIQLGKLSNYNGVSSQKVITYERPGIGANIHEISTVGYVQQYMKTAQAMVYAGLLDASTGEITDYNNAIISPSEEGNVTFDYLLNGNEGETLLTTGMSFIVGTAGDLNGYTGVRIHGGETNVEVGDMIIITDVTQNESEAGGSTYNVASILIVQNNLEIFDGKDWATGEGVTKARQVYDFVKDEIRNAIPQVTDLKAIKDRLDALDGKVSTLEGKVSTIEGNIGTINGEIATIKSNLESGKYHSSWEGEE